MTSAETSAIVEFVVTGLCKAYGTGLPSTEEMDGYAAAMFSEAQRTGTRLDRDSFVDNANAWLRQTKGTASMPPEDADFQKVLQDFQRTTVQLQKVLKQAQKQSNPAYRTKLSELLQSEVMEPVGNAMKVLAPAAKPARRSRHVGFSVLEEEEENPAAHAKIRSRQATKFVRRSAPTEEEDEDMEAGEDEDGMLDAMANARAAAARK